MAEHEEKIFEHEIADKLKSLDARIKTPDIPDAQKVFELAEKKTKVVSFAKYRKFATIAAAVVLIVASVPLFGGILSGNIGADMAANEAAMEPEYQETAEEAVTEYILDETESKSAFSEEDGFDGEAMEPAEAPEAAYNEGMGALRRDDLEGVLYSFFSSIKKEKTESDSLPGDSVSEMSVILNSKRSIDIEVEGDSVSVLLYDTSADNEVISAFWVEGIYQGSGTEEEIYYINLSKKITAEDFESGNWLPMAGDVEKGGYVIDGSTIPVPEKIVHGVIEMRVEIDIASGEYVINAKIE